jgi:hypothetical protein
MGIAFLIVAIALSRSIGEGWWFWLLLPAFSMMGTGIAQYIRLKEQEKKNLLVNPPGSQSFPDRYAPPPRNLSAPQTGEMRSPVSSVTEGTTRHLGVERQPRPVPNQSELLEQEYRGDAPQPATYRLEVFYLVLY